MSVLSQAQQVRDFNVNQVFLHNHRSLMHNIYSNKIAILNLFECVFIHEYIIIIYRV